MAGILQRVCRFLIAACEDRPEKVLPQEWRMSHRELKSVFDSTFPGATAWIWDRWYYYVTLEDWGRIIKDVLYNMPRYTSSRFDCENFAMLCSSRVSERYKVNMMAVAIGRNPSGPHGFNVFVSRVDDEPRLFILEPQTGMVYEPEEDSGYSVREVIFA